MVELLRFLTKSGFAKLSAQISVFCTQMSALNVDLVLFCRKNAILCTQIGRFSELWLLEGEKRRLDGIGEVENWVPKILRFGIPKHEIWYV